MNKLIMPLIVLLVALPAAAHDYAKKSLSIDHPWARSTIVMSAPGSAYLTIKNAGDQPDRLLRVEIGQDVVASTELHTTVIESGMARMLEAKDGMVVPARGELVFAPEGKHIMLMGVQRALEVGDKFPGTLVFERAGAVEVEFWVEEGGDNDGMEHHHHGHH